ncbi:hypothetical protein [Rhizobium bangladeshense]|uniref:hypothetical protein n=1 Tax=Rhizobium bangladeshense TaxID=1138189 RepID=UPI0012E7EC0E|nr:hypothetical protein [Rhizobium bangladeshense]
MTPVDRKYTKVVERCVIETMPKTLNQGGLPICYAAAATLLGDEYNCFRKGNKNCTEVPDERRASMLDMSRFSEYIKDQDDKRDRSEYKGLKQGGSIHKTLDSLWYADMVAPKSCVSDTAHFIGGFDPQNTTASDVDRMGQMWNEMAEFHKKLKGAPISLREAEGLKKAYQMQQQATTIELAFAEKTWPLVLDKLLIPEICRDWMDGPEHISYVRNDHPKTFPGWDDDAKPVKSDYKNTVAMARQIICEKKRPIGTSFCAAKPMSYETLKDCSDKQLGHAVVIEGYARVCTTNSADCVDSVKVRNSWGDNWQKQNNDGWIDAKTLLDSTFYSPDALVWMEEKPKEQY